MRIGKDGKTKEMRRTDQRRWRNLEKKFGSVRLEKTVSVHSPVQVQFCTFLRRELCEAKVGQDGH